MVVSGSEASSWPEWTEDEASELLKGMKRLEHLQLQNRFSKSSAEKASLKHFAMAARSTASVKQLSMIRMSRLVGLDLASDTLEHVSIELDWDGDDVLHSLSEISSLRTLKISRSTEVVRVGALSLAPLEHLQEVTLSNVRPSAILLPVKCALSISCDSYCTDEMTEWGDDPVWKQVSSQMRSVQMLAGTAVWKLPAVLLLPMALRDANINLKGGRGHRTAVHLGGALASAERCSVAVEGVDVIIPSVRWTRFAIYRREKWSDDVAIHFEAGCNPGATWWLRNQTGVSRIELGERWCDDVCMQQSCVVLRNMDSLCSGNLGGRHRRLDRPDCD